MRRYKFHLVNDGGFMPGEEGLEMADLEAVRGHATQAIADILAEELRQGKTDIHLAVLVDTEEGERVAHFTPWPKLSVDESPFAQ